MLPRRHAVLAATVALTGCALLVPAAASAAPADTAGSVTGALQTWGGSAHYASGQFVVTNTSGSAASWSLSFDVPNGAYQNHSDWNVRATVDGDRVTLTPKSGPLDPGMSEYVSFGIAGDGSADLGVTGCDLGGGAVDGCSSDGEHDEAPTSPSNVMVQDVRRDGATVTWTPGTDDDRVLQHTVEVLRDGTVIRQYIVPGATGHEKTIDRLEADTRYGVRVTAHDTAGHETSSAETTFTTAPDDAVTPPAAPADVRVNTPESNRVVVNWTSAPEPGLLGYHVDLYRDGAVVRQHIVGDPAQAAALVDRLDAATDYEVSVTAYAANGLETTSERIAFTTAG